MTDRLTPPMLRDLADVWKRGYEYPNLTVAEFFREEAARREAEQREPQYGDFCGGHPCVGTCAGPCTPRIAEWKKRREAEAKELGRTPASTGEAESSMAASVPVREDVDPIGEREGPESAAAPFTPADGERIADLPANKQLTELLTHGLTPRPPYIGPDKEFAKAWNKPAPADDLVARLRNDDPTFLLNEEAADRIDKAEARVRELDGWLKSAQKAALDAQDNALTANQRWSDAFNAGEQFKAERDAEKARADRLAAALREAADGLRYWLPSTSRGAFEKARISNQVDAALASEGGDRAKA